MTLGPTFAKQSYIGDRELNEDRAAIFHRDDASLIVVADGLGGHAGGEIASQALIDAVGETFLDLTTEQLNDPAAFMNLSVNYAHKCIHKSAAEHGLLEYVPKTTAVLALLIDSTLHWCHVGDSRLYIIRDGLIVFHTSDHIAKGYGKNAPINRCVGGIERPVPTISSPIDLEMSDRVFLCSDGAWKNVEVEDILGINQKYPQPDLDILLRKLERRNSYPSDNVTAAMVCWGELDEAQQANNNASNKVAKNKVNADLPKEISEAELDKILKDIKF